MPSEIHQPDKLLDRAKRYVSPSILPDHSTFRFNIVSEDEKKKSRVERFGVVESEPAEMNSDSIKDVQKLKDRSNRYENPTFSLQYWFRFGTPKPLIKKEEDTKRKVRQSRFAVSGGVVKPTAELAEKLAKRAERFAAHA